MRARISTRMRDRRLGSVGATIRRPFGCARTPLERLPCIGVALVVIRIFTCLLPGSESALGEELRSRAPSEPLPSPEWFFLGSAATRGESPRVLASDASGTHFAMGDAAGVTWLRLDGADHEARARRDRAVLRGVRDLVFDRRRVLWIATAEGLYRWSENERPVRRSMRGGEGANRILRLAANASGLLVATDDGAFWSSTGGVFQRLAVGSAAARVSLVAIEPDEMARRAPSSSISKVGLPVHPRRLWILAADELYEVEGFIRDSGWRISSARRIPLPRPIVDRAPVDLSIDGVDRELRLVFDDSVASRSVDFGLDRPSGTAHRPEGSQRSGGFATDTESANASPAPWRVDRPILPPGAAIRRVARDRSGRYVIATSRGLIEGERLDGIFKRSSHPLGSSECMDLRTAGRSTLVALCRRGVYMRRDMRRDVRGDEKRDPKREEGDSAPSKESSRARVDLHDSSVTSNSRRVDLVSAAELGPDPPLAEIRARAIHRAGLSADRIRRIRSGLRQQAYWPELKLRFGAEVDRDREKDFDQSVVSGQTRRLLDETHDRRLGFGASIELDWDLRGVAYPEDTVDLSRELRQVISLRDDISDEINQLYFERQAIRQRLASDRSISREEEDRLRLRSRELNAGLDAWTGGWLSRWRTDRAALKPEASNTPGGDESVPSMRILVPQTPSKGMDHGEKMD